ncbi:acetate operon repressor [Mycobacterium lentiflavum]|uniref:Glycerol operon regulatory protein n=1 Tax=Mycobacterium lentiflavum TaxID=141349 RepID=A0A0E3WE47_MYCLN|nr:IclR family transcriptional regulator [Mycobacterium lentiflavum]CQD23040.1 acetate operon repressor [Mycobacterium lentiflavum]
MSFQGDADTVQSVARTFAILEHMAASGGEAGVSDLAGQLGLALPTIHRLMRTLMSLGYVRQLPSRRYALGPALARLSHQAYQMLGEWARPSLLRLEAAVGETANLATLDGEMVAYIGQIPSRHQMRMFTEVGRRVHAHSTGVGKAILSVLDERSLRRIIDHTGMPKYTDRTIVDFVKLQRELDVIRARGYAIDDGEQEDGVRCLALAVPGALPPTAVSVSGPSSRITADSEERIVEALCIAADELSEVLGGYGKSSTHLGASI